MNKIVSDMKTFVSADLSSFDFSNRKVPPDSLYAPAAKKCAALLRELAAIVANVNRDSGGKNEAKNSDEMKKFRERAYQIQIQIGELGGMLNNWMAEASEDFDF